MEEKSPLEREAIRECGRYKTLYQKWDLYIPFMEPGLHLLKDGGHFAMIVPYPLTNQTYSKKMWETFIEQYSLFEITDLNGTKVFDSATVSNCVPFIKKSEPQASCYISYIDDQKSIKKLFSKPFNILVQDKESAVWNLTEEE